MTEAFDIKSSSLNAGVHVLEASAGTGKTFAIESLVLRFLLEKQLPIEKILLVTFTEAATAELRTRVRQRLAAAEHYFTHATVSPSKGKAEDELLEAILTNAGITAATAIQRLRAALLLFDQARIFTIHGFCRRSLQEFSFECGYLFDAEMISDATSLTDAAVNDYWRKYFIRGESKLHATLILQKGSVRKNYAKVLAQLLRNPHVNWLDQNPKNTFSDVLVTMEKKCETLRGIFLSDAEAIYSVLLKDDWGNKGYKRNDLERELARLKTGAEENNFLMLTKAFAYFSETALAGAKNKRNKTILLPEHRFFDLCADWCNALTSFYQADLKHFAEFSKARLLKSKTDLNVRDFNDLLADMWSAVDKDNPRSAHLIQSMRSVYSVALIDEFQDTDMRQWEIFRRLFVDELNGQKSVASLFLIGDPKQAIYSFRGGDIFTYLNAKRFSSEEKTLQTNYRSDARLVDTVNALFSRKENVFELRGLDFHRVEAAKRKDENGKDEQASHDDPPFVVTLFDYDKELTKRICGLVANDCVRLLKEKAKVVGSDGSMRELSVGDICVLVRENAEGIAVRDTLLQCRISAVFRGSMSIFKSEEARDILLLMKALTVKRSRGYMHAAMASVLFSFQGDARLFFDDAAFEAEFDYLHSLGNVWEAEGFARMCAKLFRERSVRTSVLAMKNGERRITNFLQLIQILQEEAMVRNLSTLALTRWLEEQMAESGLGAKNEIYEQRLESDSDAVQILTIHKSKGLEFPVCFCAFHSNDLRAEVKDLNAWHDDSGKAYFRLEGGLSDLEIDRARTEAESEALRLLYVSITRAKYRCYLYFGSKSGSDKAGNSSLNLLCENDFATALRTHYFDIPDGSMTIRDLNHLPQENDLSVYTSEAQNHQQAKALPFSGRIAFAKRLTSFSSMIANQGDDDGHGNIWIDDRDVDDTASDDEEVEVIPINPAAQLPRGTGFGEFMHKLFEFLPESNFVFEDALAKVKENSANIAMDETIMKSLCESVLSASLSDGAHAFSLYDIPVEKWMREWSFYFPLKHISPNDLRALFSRYAKSNVKAVADAMGRLRFSPIQGFVRGFIDLLFEHKGKFYILDWKSNWIGDTPEAYTSEAILEQMTEHNYFLQYHLYTLALHRYLKTSMKNYVYEKHFGGVFYIFARGVSSEKAGNGIFYDFPDKELVDALESELIAKRRSCFSRNFFSRQDFLQL